MGCPDPNPAATSMVRMVTVTAAPNAEAEVVDLVSALIRFDTSNTGEPDTTKGEAECARWVAEQLAEVGYACEYVEAGAPGRGNVFARLDGARAQTFALHHVSIPTNDADMRFAMVPANIARIPSLARLPR